MRRSQKPQNSCYGISSDHRSTPLKQNQECKGYGNWDGFCCFCCRQGGLKGKWNRYKTHPHTDTCTYMPRQTHALSIHRYTQADTYTFVLWHRSLPTNACGHFVNHQLQWRRLESLLVHLPLASVRSFPAIYLHFVQPSFNYAKQRGYFLVSGSIILPPNTFHCHDFFHGMLPEFPFLYFFSSSPGYIPLNHSR